MFNVSFLILHYRTLEETKLCISTIDVLDKTDCKVDIVVVDNLSQDGSYERLTEDYADRDDIVLLEAGGNIGFSKGNNLGYSYIRENLNPDFIVMTNSDTEFRQKEFLQQLIKVYRRKTFSILGPDIYAYRLGIHQNPVKKELPPLEAHKQELDSQKAFYKWLTELEAQGKTEYPFNREQKRERFLVKHHLLGAMQWIREYFGFLFPTYLSYKKEHENVMLHGSCMIFSKDYIKKYKMGLYPEPYFYGEEDLMLLKAIRNHDRICYDPSLTVWHQQDAAINKTKGADNKIAKAKFKYENYIATKTLFIRVLEDKNYFSETFENES